MVPRVSVLVYKKIVVGEWFLWVTSGSGGVYRFHSQSMVRTSFMDTLRRVLGSVGWLCIKEEEEMDLGISQPVLAISLNYPMVDCMRKQQ